MVEPLVHKDLKAGFMIWISLGGGGGIGITAGGKIVKIPPGDPPPVFREVEVAANMLAQADTIRDASLRKRVASYAEGVIKTKAPELQAHLERVAR